MRSRVLLRVGLAYLVLMLGVSGAWALFMPAHFWDTYPGFGLEFVEPLPAYNEHLINDFGGLYLALAAILAVSLVRPVRLLVTTSLVGVLVYGIPHFVFHVTHLEPFDAAEVVAQVIVVGSFVVIPVGLLVLVSRSPSAAEPI